jgi:hypothetical protein
MEERTDDFRRVLPITRIHERPQRAHFIRGDDPERHTDGIRGGAVLLILVHAFATRREPQVTADVKAHVLAGLGAEALVQIHRIFVELADRVAHVEERQQAGGVPGRSGRELGSLEQHDIGPTFLREVIQRADAYHPAADDHYPRVRFQSRGLVPQPLIRFYPQAAAKACRRQTIRLNARDVTSQRFNIRSAQLLMRAPVGSIAGAASRRAPRRSPMISISKPESACARFVGT